MDQSNLLLEIIEKRNNKSRPKSKWNISNTSKTRYRINASKITNSSCTSKSR